jgi:hypothetical protein
MNSVEVIFPRLAETRLDLANTKLAIE